MTGRSGQASTGAHVCWTGSKGRGRGCGGRDGVGGEAGRGERRKVVGSVCCWRVSVMEPTVAEKCRLEQFCSTFNILTDQSVGGATLLLQAFLQKIRDGNCL